MVGHTRARAESIHDYPTDDWVEDVMRRFFQQARALARARIARGMRRRVGPTDVASRSVFDVVLAARTQNRAFGDAEFVRLLRRIVRSVAVDAIRKARTESRAIGRKMEAGAAAVEAGQTAPEVLASIPQLAERVTAWIDARPDETERFVARLVFLEGLAASRVAGLLAAEVGANPQSGLRRLRARRIQKVTAGLRDEFRRAFVPK